MKSIAKLKGHEADITTFKKWKVSDIIHFETTSKDGVIYVH